MITIYPKKQKIQEKNLNIIISKRLIQVKLLELILDQYVLVISNEIILEINLIIAINFVNLNIA